MLTGEPLPVERGPGQPVTGGTRNGEGVLVVRVGTVAGESVLARLQRLVDEAQRDKAPLQRLADRISAVFVPAVLAGSALTFLAWWLAAGNTGQAVLSALAVLLVACPCAMGLAAPVAMMVGCGRAAALGIFIRNGDVLERLAKVDGVAFDKTGTLTERHAEVTSVTVVPGTTADEVTGPGRGGRGGERPSHRQGHPHGRRRPGGPAPGPGRAFATGGWGDRHGGGSVGPGGSDGPGRPPALAADRCGPTVRHSERRW